MKKIFFAFMAVAAIALVGCRDKNNDPQPEPQQPEKPGKVTKHADYLYEYEAGNYGTQAPSYVLMDGKGRVSAFGCSAVRNGNYYGRNLDFDINEICEFVIHAPKTDTRKHASIGVANSLFYTITDQMVKDTLPDSTLNYLPWLTMDGINDAGLVCNINVVNMADIKANFHTHTNPNVPEKIMVLNLVRALLDNCGSVDEAKQFILAHDILPIPNIDWDGHIMIADPNNTVIVEFTGGNTPEECVHFVTQEQNIMTNFYNHLFKEENFLRDDSINNFPKHACGMERYFILSHNYATANSMEGMWELLKKVKYTQAYDERIDPFWVTEHIDGFPDGDITWTKERLLKQPGAKNKLAAYNTYAKTGYYDPKDGLWFTAHNSTYDIPNKTLWVTIREKYEKHYEFKLE